MVPAIHRGGGGDFSDFSEAGLVIFGIGIGGLMILPIMFFLVGVVTEVLAGNLPNPVKNMLMVAVAPLIVVRLLRFVTDQFFPYDASILHIALIVIGACAIGASIVVALRRPPESPVQEGE